MSSTFSVRRASIVLPAPGGPIRRVLCHVPAADWTPLARQLRCHSLATSRAAEALIAAGSTSGEQATWTPNRVADPQPAERAAPGRGNLQIGHHKHGLMGGIRL